MTRSMKGCELAAVVGLLAAALLFPAVGPGGLPETTHWFAHALAHHPTDPNAVIAGLGDESQAFGFTPGVPGSGAVYLSENRGESWTSLIEGLPSVTVVEATAGSK